MLYDLSEHWPRVRGFMRNITKQKRHSTWKALPCTHKHALKSAGIFLSGSNFYLVLSSVVAWLKGRSGNAAKGIVLHHPIRKLIEENIGFPTQVTGRGGYTRVT